MPGGRPSKYNTDYVRMAYEVMLLGATINDLAIVLNVNADTIYSWQKSYPEFSESIRRGRDYFDSDKVERSLLQRALGYNYDKIKYQLIPPPLPEHPTQEQIETADKNVIAIPIQKTTKHVPPSDKAIRFWLMNRHPERWGSCKYKS
jgi:hypothetical protein